MNKIFDVSPIDLPFCDAIGRATSTNHYTEWVREALEAPTEDNARIDGSSSNGINDTVTGERLGNYHQIATKTVRVSDRARNSNTVGASDELVRQIMKRQKALRRDVEARVTGAKVAIPGDGTGIASETAAVGAWIKTNTNRGNGGTEPVLSGDPGGYPTTIATVGTKRAMSETDLREVLEEAFIAGGDPSLAMSTPAVIQKFSSYLFSSSARIATLQSTVSQGNRTTAGSGNGNAGGGVVAQGSVNIFVHDFGSVELCPNRFQPETAAGVANLYLIDADYWELTFLQGYETKPLARDGLGENREISVDFALKSLAEEASGVVADIDTTLEMVA